MLTLSLTRQQLYELYHEGVQPTIRLIENLIEQLSDFERILGKHQQQIIDVQHTRNDRLAARLKRVEAKLVRKECEVYALTRRINELQAELERMRRAPSPEVPPEVQRDSHNSGLPPRLIYRARKPPTPFVGRAPCGASPASELVDRRGTRARRSIKSSFLTICVCMRRNIAESVRHRWWMLRWSDTVAARSSIFHRQC